jgi:hypothetical protein
VAVEAEKNEGGRIKDEKGREDGSSFILHPSSFILHPSFILPRFRDQHL